MFVGEGEWRDMQSGLPLDATKSYTLDVYSAIILLKEKSHKSYKKPNKSLRGN